MGKPYSRSLTPLVVCAVLLLIGYSSPAIAQSIDYCKTPPSGYVPGGFTPGSVSVCQGRVLKITAEISGLIQVRYDFDYKGGELSTGSTTRETIYNSAGQFIIIQQGIKGGSPSIACATVSVLSTAAIQFGLSSCTNRRVVLTFQPTATTSSYSRISINWGDGSVELATSMGAPRLHQYAKDGSYTVTVVGEYTNVETCGSTPAKQTISVGVSIPSTPFISSLDGIDQSTIRLTTQETANSESQLWRGNAGLPMQPTSSTITSGNSYTHSVPIGQSVCFQLRGVNGCQQLLQSDIVCTIPTSVSARDGFNRIWWQPYKGQGVFRSWLVARDREPIPISGSTDPSTSTTDDHLSTVCGRTYCYVVSASVGPTTIRSAPACTVGYNATVPPLPVSVMVTLDPGGKGQALVDAVFLKNEMTDTFGMGVYRKEVSSSGYTNVATIANVTRYTENVSVDPGDSYCYRVTEQTACSISSPLSKPACSIWLSGNAASGIFWTGESPFANEPIKTYLLRCYDNTTRQLIDEKDMGLSLMNNPDLTDPNTLDCIYQVVAVSLSGRRSYSNLYRFIAKTGVYIPTAFTPNGDGHNDVFEVNSTPLQSFELLVYDRWGGIIFQSVNQSIGWDGRVGGQEAPAGVYVYQLRVRTKADKQHIYEGKVELLR